MKRRLMRAMAALTLASCLVPALAIASGAGTPDDAAADAIPLPAQIWDTFGDVYGPESGWHLETWAELGKLLQRSAAAHGADAQSDVGVPSASVSSRPDGKPPIWYSDLAPVYYWEALDEVGFNADTASALREQWAEAYGDDMRFWPLEAQALISLWQGVSAKVLPGLPGEQDMPQKEAVSLAWDRLRRFAVFEHADLAYVDSLQPAVSFLFNAPEQGDHTWRIEFIDTSRRPNAVFAYVLIDAKTGEVLEEPCDGNG